MKKVYDGLVELQELMKLSYSLDSDYLLFDNIPPRIKDDMLKLSKKINIEISELIESLKDVSYELYKKEKESE